MKVTEFKMYAQSDMVSLYDYYGRAQGKERGLEIWGMAKEDGGSRWVRRPSEYIS